MAFRLACVHIIFSLVWVAEWLPFAFWEVAARSVGHLFSLYFGCL